MILPKMAAVFHWQVFIKNDIIKKLNAAMSAENDMIVCFWKGTYVKIQIEILPVINKAFYLFYYHHHRLLVHHGHYLR